MPTPVFPYADFIAIFPEFSSDTSTHVEAVEGFVMDEVSKDAFGTQYVKALMLMTAHMLTVIKRRGNGAVESERVGDLARTYKLKDIYGALDMTSYGLQFQKLARGLALTPIFSAPAFNEAVVDSNIPRMI